MHCILSCVFECPFDMSTPLVSKCERIEEIFRTKWCTSNWSLQIYGDHYFLDFFFMRRGRIHRPRRFINYDNFVQAQAHTGPGPAQPSPYHFLSFILSSAIFHHVHGSKWDGQHTICTIHVYASSSRLVFFCIIIVMAVIQHQHHHLSFT